MNEIITERPIIVRYGEIGIKSPKVRRRFERRLISNIKSLIDAEIKIKQGRIFLFPKDYPQALEDLGKIFGVVSFSPTVCTKTDKNKIKESIQEYVQDIIAKEVFSPKQSFAIRCRRVGEHKFTSQEIAAYCGSVVVEETGAPVKLKNPDFELYVEVREDKTYLFHEKIPGLGGLPVGTQGRVVALVSGGIDSPVAAFLMMKRGCALTILHFNTGPYTQCEGSCKILKMVDKLKEYSSGSKLNFYTINYGDYLQKAMEEAPPRMTCVLCKSGMYQIAEEVAKKEKAQALVDGSSLGQVASQTLPNILATRHSTSLPVLSPLIGMDKVEIQKIAEKIGTFEISILPESDCAAAPKHPETNAVLETVLQVQEDLNLKDEIQKALKTLEEIF
ncbi:MAG TPA: tRNA uracil 4-sulfurtransferase ThiI [Methanobacterium sp.]|nr:tRNA uracil 4-sulfurtransferase ThiI [Methanobacterium sp.]